MPTKTEVDVLQQKLERRTTPPYWWPDRETVMQLFLAVSIVTLVGYIIHQLLSGEALKIDPSVRDLIVFIFGIVFSNFKDVFGYTFGSSTGAKNAGDAMRKSLDSKDKIIADQVVTAATVSADAVKVAADKAPSTDALKAAAAVAPLAAAVAAPPAAEVAAPPAAEKAVADALAKAQDLNTKPDIGG